MNNIKIYYNYGRDFIELSKSKHNAKFQYSKTEGAIKFYIEASARPDVILELMDKFESIKNDINSVYVGDYKICDINESRSVDIFMTDSRIETTEYMQSDTFPILNLTIHLFSFI